RLHRPALRPRLAACRAPANVLERFARWRCGSRTRLDLLRAVPAVDRADDPHHETTQPRRLSAGQPVPTLLAALACSGRIRIGSWMVGVVVAFRRRRTAAIRAPAQPGGTGADRRPVAGGVLAAQ